MTSEVQYSINSWIAGPEVARLFDAVGWGEEAALPHASLEQAFNQDAVNATARREEELVGMVRGKKDGMYVFLLNLVVHPEHRGRGIAHRLFSMVEHEAASVPGIFALIGLAANEHLEFYERHLLSPVNRLAVISNRPNV